MGVRGSSLAQPSLRRRRTTCLAQRGFASPRQAAHALPGQGWGRAGSGLRRARCPSSCGLLRRWSGCRKSFFMSARLLLKRLCWRRCLASTTRSTASSSVQWTWAYRPADPEGTDASKANQTPARPLACRLLTSCQVQLLRPEAVLTRSHPFQFLRGTRVVNVNRAG